MPGTAKRTVPVIGIIFLSLAAYKLATGNPWVVWAVLGFVFGGFGIFTLKGDK